MMRALLIPFCLAAILSTADVASAGRALRSGTHKNWFSFAIGPAIHLMNAPNQVLMVQTFGHHFSRNASGPAIALDIQEHLAGGIFVLQTGPRFVYDIQVARRVGFYLSPSFGVEYTFSTGGPHHGFSVPFLFKLKFVLGNRGLLFFQPVGIDLMALFTSETSYTALQYDLLFGGGVIF